MNNTLFRLPFFTIFTFSHFSILPFLHIFRFYMFLGSVCFYTVPFSIYSFVYLTFFSNFPVFSSSILKISFFNFLFLSLLHPFFFLFSLCPICRISFYPFILITIFIFFRFFLPLLLNFFPISPFLFSFSFSFNFPLCTFTFYHQNLISYYFTSFYFSKLSVFSPFLFSFFITLFHFALFFSFFCKLQFSFFFYFRF